MDTCITNIKELKQLLEDADHSDIKVGQGQTSLREFIAAMLSYFPWWISFLLRIREVFVRIFGLVRHQKPEKLPHFHPDDVPFTAGETAGFFIVRVAKEGEYWVSESPEDKHLRAYLAVIMEPLKDNINRFQVITIVHYKHWTGPVYFNLIRPFHHLVVRRMIRAGLKKSIFRRQKK